MFTHLWYVVLDEAFGNRLLKLWHDVNGDINAPQFGWIYLADILTDPISAKIQLKGSHLALTHFLNPKTKQSHVMPAHSPAHPVGKV